MKILVVSDLHIGSIGAMWPAGVTPAGQAPFTATPRQKILREAWLQFVSWARGHSPDLLVVAGDAVDGPQPAAAGEGLIASDAPTQAQAAALLLEPLVKAARRTIIVAGTPYHVGARAEGEAILATLIEATPTPEGWPTWGYFAAEYSGARIDIVHKMPVSDVNHAATLARILSQCCMREVPPDVIVRAHAHRATEIMAPDGRRALSTPGWSFPTPALVRHVPSLRPPVVAGGVVIELRGPRWEEGWIATQWWLRQLDDPLAPR